MEAWEQKAIRQILAGDREQYRVLMESHLPAVFRMALRVTGNSEDAEEVAQEAFLLAYNKLPTFREQAAFGTWVYRIAMNCSLNLVKRRARQVVWNAEPLDNNSQPQAAAISPRPSPEAAVLDAEARARREQAMTTLTPMEKTAFVLRHMEDQPVEGIAHALGISANAARQAIFRAVAKLRCELASSLPRPNPALPSSPIVREELR